MQTVSSDEMERIFIEALKKKALSTLYNTNANFRATINRLANQGYQPARDWITQTFGIRWCTSEEIKAHERELNADRKDL